MLRLERKMFCTQRLFYSDAWVSNGVFAVNRKNLDAESLRVIAAGEDAMKIVWRPTLVMKMREDQDEYLSGLGGGVEWEKTWWRWRAGHRETFFLFCDAERRGVLISARVLKQLGIRYADALFGAPPESGRSCLNPMVHRESGLVIMCGRLADDELEQLPLLEDK